MERNRPSDNQRANMKKQLTIKDFVYHDIGALIGYYAFTEGDLQITIESTLWGYEIGVYKNSDPLIAITKEPVETEKGLSEKIKREEALMLATKLYQKYSKLMNKKNDK